MIIKNCIVSEQYQRHIENVVTDPIFPWSFLKDVTSSDTQNNAGNAGFSHLAFNTVDNMVTSKFYDIFYSLLLSICEKLDYKITNLIRIRVGCVLPREQGNTHNTLHTDFEFPHDVMLYYVNTCDGDTIVHTPDQGVVSITPESGKVVLFDGSYKHASSTPIESGYRFVITFNLNGEHYEN
jgi:oxalate decarboxylase/phosphoglucose isomerase-like protein (cupin superfamily)